MSKNITSDLFIPHFNLSFHTEITYNELMNLKNAQIGDIYKCSDNDYWYVYLEDGVTLLYPNILDITISDKKEKTVYIIGDRTFDNDCRKTFNDYELILKNGFKDVINPVRIYDINKYYDENIKELCIAELRKSDCVYLIDGWKNCKQAKYELKMALELELEII